MSAAPARTLSIHLRLMLTALALLGLMTLVGALPINAQPRTSGAVRPHAAVTATVLHAFNPNTEGYQPEYGLVQGLDGSLYGVTRNGGDNGNGSGIVFKVAPDGTNFTILHTFQSDNEGAQPEAKLLLVGNLLFGTCQSAGGDNYGGTVFVINLAQVSPTSNTAGYGVLHYFGYTFGTNAFGGTTLIPDATDGTSPEGSLFLGADGNIYGTTNVGGMHGKGTVFRLSPNSSGQFSATPSPPNSGSDYYSYQGAYQAIYSFGGGVADGANPQGGVVQLSDGFLYGTTFQGGNPTSTGGSPVQNTTSFGTVYKVATDGSGFTLLHAFTGGIVFGPNGITRVGDGEAPECDLIQAADGDLYGTTYYGGPGNAGTVFQIKPDSHGVFSANSPFGTIAALSNNTGNELPGGVIQASDGNLYGTTLTGGPGGSGDGSVFQIMPDPSTGRFDAIPDSQLTYGVTSPDPFTEIYTFLGQYAPGNPDSPLVQGLNGQLYGESLVGGQLANGSSAGGTVFAVDAKLPYITSVTTPGGSASIPPTATSIMVHGVNLVGTPPTVSVNGRAATVTAQNFTNTADETLTVTLASALIAGSNADSVLVTNAVPDGRPTNRKLFSVTAPAPTISSVAYAAGATVFTIHGANFVNGSTNATTSSVTIDGSASDITGGVYVTGPTNQIVFDLTTPLAGGPHTVIVTNPNGQSSAAFPFTVASPAPTINAPTGTPPGVQYAIVNGIATLTINGANLHSGATVSLGNAATGTILGPFSGTGQGSQIVYTLPTSVPPATYVVVLTNPDTQQVNAALFVPVITNVTYDGALTLTINGAGFDPILSVGVTNTATSDAITLNRVSDQQITVTLPQPLPNGFHTITVKNIPETVTLYPAAEQAAYTTYTNPGAVPVVSLIPTVPNFLNGAITAGGLAIETDNGNVAASIVRVTPGPEVLPSQAQSRPAVRNLLSISPHTTVSGQPIIYTATAIQYQIGNQILQDLIIYGANLGATSNGQPSPSITVDGQNLNTLAYGSDGEFTTTLNPFNLDITKPHTVVVTNNGQSSLVGNFAILNYITGPQSAYDALLSQSVLTGPGTSTVLTSMPSLNALPLKVTLGASIVAQGGGNIVAQGGGNIVAAGGGNIVAAGGGNIVAQGGGNIVAQGGGNGVPVASAGIVAAGGGNAVQLPADSLIQGSTAGIVAAGGGNLITNTGTGIVAAGGGNAISNTGASIVAQGGGNFTVSGIVAQGGGNLRMNAASLLRGAAAAVAQTASPTVPAISGSTDVSLLVSKGGQYITLVTIRETPGQQDIIVYKDPRVTLTPRLGTPPPVTVSALPVTVTRGPLTVDHSAAHQGQLYQTLTLKNTGASVVPGPVLVGLTGLPAGVTVTTAANLIAGSPAATVTNGALAPGATAAVRVYFNDPGNAHFSYGTAVYTGAQ